MKSSPKKSRPSTSSPSKSPTKISVNREVEALNDEIQELQFKLGNRDIEIERMETTLVALNQKLEALQDVRVEVEHHTKLFQNSEAERGDQQTLMVKLAHKVRIESETHEEMHDKSRNEIEKLLQDIQDGKDYLH